MNILLIYYGTKTIKIRYFIYLQLFYHQNFYYNHFEQAHDFFTRQYQKKNKFHQLLPCFFTAASKSKVILLIPDEHDSRMTQKTTHTLAAKLVTKSTDPLTTRYYLLVVQLVSSLASRVSFSKPSRYPAFTAYYDRVQDVESRSRNEPVRFQTIVNDTDNKNLPRFNVSFRLLE